MLSCPTVEKVKSYVVANPTAVGAIQTTEDGFHVITVFNETDKPIKVSYKDTSGNASDFIVPPNGRTFTRVMHAVLLLGSLHVKSTTEDATGYVYINLGN